MARFVSQLLANQTTEPLHFVSAEVDRLELGNAEELHDLLLVVIIDAVVSEDQSTNTGHVANSRNQLLKTGFGESEALEA